MKTYGGVEVQFHHSWPRTLDAGEWSASRPDRFILKEIASRYPLDRILRGPNILPEHSREEKNLSPTGNRTPAVQPISSRYTNSRLQF
jgi:hypothetical protein